MSDINKEISDLRYGTLVYLPLFIITVFCFGFTALHSETELSSKAQRPEPTQQSNDLPAATDKQPELKELPTADNDSSAAMTPGLTAPSLPSADSSDQLQSAAQSDNSANEEAAPAPAPHKDPSTFHINVPKAPILNHLTL